MPMHPSSFDKMKNFRGKYLAGRETEPLTILDLGSQEIITPGSSGTYRSLFAEPSWRYIGVDMAAGLNVDVVLRDPYNWTEIAPESVDVLISGQTFEHTEYFWLTMQQIARTLKPNGICCIIAPSSGPEHRFPVDCWRMYPDGLRAVARYAGLEVLAAETQWEDLPQYDNESNKWHDSMLIARKPARSSEALPPPLPPV